MPKQTQRPKLGVERHRSWAPAQRHGVDDGSVPPLVHHDLIVVRLIGQVLCTVQIIPAPHESTTALKEAYRARGRTRRSVPLPLGWTRCSLKRLSFKDRNGPVANWRAHAALAMTLPRKHLFPALNDF